MGSTDRRAIDSKNRLVAFMNGKNPLFSVVVPVYNSVKWIEECIRSVLSQSLGDFELILVDDGSTDGAGELCERVCEIDDRVRLVRQSNLGVSVARNHGLDMATGLWVLFLDADDLLQPRALETMAEAVKASDVDILYFRYEVFDENGKMEISPSYGPLTKGTIRSARAIRALLEGDPKEMPWCYLARRDLYGSGEDAVRFPPGIGFMEDAATTWRVVSRARGVTFIDDVLHGYRETPSSKVASISLGDAEDVVWVLEHSFYGGTESFCPGLSRSWWAHRAMTAVIGYDRAWRSDEVGQRRDRLCCELRSQALRSFVRAGILKCGPLLTLKIVLIASNLWSIVARRRGPSVHRMDYGCFR